LTDLVEAAIIEFDRITERGGVLGAMETMYQRSKIQEESLYYETLNTQGIPNYRCKYILSSKGSPTVIPAEVIRATEKEKLYQITMLENLHKANHDKVDEMLNTIQEAAINNENLFDHLMEATKVCSLGQITSALFEVGGQYRRNM
jgi:methylmalonyl-CoA mutase